MTLVIVPYRADGGHRDRIWRHLQDHYWGGLPYRIVVGSHDGGPFNRSAAINAAAAQPWEVAVIADADTWVPPAHLAEAVTTARRTGRLTAAFTAVIELDRPCTKAVLDGHVELTTLGVNRVRTAPLETQSSMLAIPRPLWDTIGGFDPRFVGWGGEDNAFWKAATLLGGQPHRIDGPAFHLWHPTTVRATSGPQYQANHSLWRCYARARTVPQLRRAMP